MSGYTLTCKPSQSPALVDGSLLRPDTLGHLTVAELAATLLPIGRAQVALGDVFDIAGDAGPMLTLRHPPLLDRLGSHMQHGTIIIEGDAGDDLGASMSGGIIHVTGNAGHRVGGPAVTSKRGMTGGEIIIDGNAGDFAGFLMRRGLIAIAGATGKSPGYRMLAGTIVLGSACTDAPGLEMQRGTILCLDHAQTPASFSKGGIIDASAMPALLLVIKRLRELHWPCVMNDTFDAQSAAHGAWQLWSGDRLMINKGEVLQWQD